MVSYTSLLIYFSRLIHTTTTTIMVSEDFFTNLAKLYYTSVVITDDALPTHFDDALRTCYDNTYRPVMATLYQPIMTTLYQPGLGHELFMNIVVVM